MAQKISVGVSNPCVWLKDTGDSQGPQGPGTRLSLQGSSETTGQQPCGVSTSSLGPQKCPTEAERHNESLSRGAGRWPCLSLETRGPCLLGFHSSNQQHVLVALKTLGLIFFLFFFKLSSSYFGHPLVREWEVTRAELSSSRAAVVWVKSLI